MKQLFIFLFCLSISSVYGQNISTINSGASSNNQLVFSVGEIYVIPETDANLGSSGIIGVTSILEFLTVSSDNILYSEDVRVFPNPTENTIHFTIDNIAINQVIIYDSTGKLIATKSITNNAIDLSTLPSGIYLLKADNPKINPFTIIKK